MMTEDPKHARFGEREERRIERSRVLTMKYGKQQMALIRRRVQVENWIEDEVTKLFAGNEDHIDLDSVLAFDAAQQRRKYAFDQLQKRGCPGSSDKVTIFLDELIRQCATL